MRFDLTSLYNDQFEDLVIALCIEILMGVGVQKYASGKDRGIDARFVGKSKLFSTEGIHIIQAKHSNSPVSTFSDNSFFKNRDSIINCEIPKIRKLYEEQELDFYILFSNRKLTAGSAIDIKNHIANATSISKNSIMLIGSEIIYEHLRTNPDIPIKYNIDGFYSSIGVVPDELMNVIEAFAKVLKPLDSCDHDQKPKAIKLCNKNKINGLSDSYFDYIKQTSYRYFDEIEKFLRNPLCLSYKTSYMESAEHLQSRVLAELSNGKTMDDILNAVYENLLNGNNYLLENKKLAKIFLHFMYCYCDIGKKNA